MLDRSLYYPTPEVVSALGTVDLPQVLDEALLLPPLTVPAFGRLEGQLRAKSSAVLVTEYIAAFERGIQDRSLLEGEFVTLDEIEVGVVAAYYEEFDVVDFLRLPPDHVVSELALIQALSFFEAERSCHVSYRALCRRGRVSSRSWRTIWSTPSYQPTSRG